MSDQPKLIGKEFTGRGEVKGFLYTQVASSDNAYMYKVSHGPAIWFEVFKRKVNTAFGLNAEAYPRSKSFGKWAWSFSKQALAIEKFNTL